MAQSPTGYAAFDKTAYLHIYVFSCLAIAQQIFDLLGDYPEFFVAHRSDRLDVLLLTFFLVYVLPLPFVVFLVALGKISRRAFTWGLAVLLSGLSGLLFLPLVKQSQLPDLMVLILAVSIGIAITTISFNTRQVRLFLSALGIALLFSPVYFLFFTPVYSSIVKQEPRMETNLSAPSDVPVIVIVFDEFPVSAIMDENLEVDRVHFPNFARLADRSYWFRNNTSVAASTILAVPAILTGNIPKRFSPPTAQAYPENLFTLLGDTHRLYVHEGDSGLCPKEICRDSQWVLPRGERLKELIFDTSVVYGHLVLPTGCASRLPSISSSWKDFAPAEGASNHKIKRLSRARLFDRFLSNIKSEVPAGLHFIHLLLPHIPYEYLPSGKRYSGGNLMPGLDTVHDRWGSDPSFVKQAYQRFLLQMGATDGMIGRMLDHLEEDEMLDAALIVVTADHGVAFDVDRNRREDLRDKILESSIMPVPLFIKTPGQTVAVVDDSNVETIDILPTVAELVGSRTRPRMDGQNVIGQHVEERPFKTFYRGYRNFWRYEAEAHLDHKNRIVAWKYDNFYDQRQTDLALSTLGPRSRLLKRDVAELGPVIVSEDQFMLNDSIDLRVDKAGDFIPAHIFGEIETGNQKQPMELAFAINGTVEATSRSYIDRGEHRFSAMVPETAFESGLNTLDIFSVVEVNGELRVEQLGNVGDQLDGYSLVTLESGHKKLTTSDLDSRITEDAEDYEVKVETSIEGRGAVEFFTKVLFRGEEPLKIEILVFEADRCVYKSVLTLDEGGNYSSRFVLPKSKFDNFGHLPIRFFALDSLRRSRELAYYTEYPYLD